MKWLNKIEEALNTIEQARSMKEMPDNVYHELDELGDKLLAIIEEHRKILRLSKLNHS